MVMCDQTDRDTNKETVNSTLVIANRNCKYCPVTSTEAVNSVQVLAQKL